MMNKAKFRIVNCCGEHIEYVNFDVSDEWTEDNDWEIGMHYTNEVLNAAGLDNDRCGQCGDYEYKVKFVKFLDQVKIEYNGRTVYLSRDLLADFVCSADLDVGGKWVEINDLLYGETQ